MHISQVCFFLRRGLHFAWCRRSIIIEGIESEFQRGIKHSHSHNDSDSEEGAKILKVLETASEPEILMAEMSPEQLSTFATYRAKIEVVFNTLLD